MARKALSWILKFTSELPTEKEKIDCLRANAVPVMYDILRYAYDPKIKWILPEGDPPYTPSEYSNLDGVLYSEIRKLYLFIEGGNNNLKPIRREAIFIEMLESVHPEDAKLLLAMKNKQLPYKGLSSKLILKAFPGLY